MKASIETIPHHHQTYETVGWWGFGKRSGNLQVFVSDMGNEDYEFLVALHELVEAWLCRKRGISDEEITAFDIDFENTRMPGNTDEPGDHENAPYKREHLFATGIEKLMAAELGIDWSRYDKTVNSL